MRTIYVKRNFSIILILVALILLCLYLIDYHFFQVDKYSYKPNFSSVDNLTQTITSNSADNNLFKMKSVLQYKVQHHKVKCSVTVVIILCQVDQYLAIKKSKIVKNPGQNSSKPLHKSVAKDFGRQINQTLVMLKSIALQTYFRNKRRNNSLLKLSGECITVIILSDRKRHFDKIKHKIDSEWSEEFQKTLNLVFLRVTYPKGSEWMKKMFRPCATLRLFIPELLSEEFKTVIYLDTDFIFLNSIQRLTDLHFGNFEGKVAAMAPCLFHYGTNANTIPFYGNSGLNAGLMLMNLTRMRLSQWTNKIRMVTAMFQHQIKLADQDILNIYFHFFPEELSTITCDWNFRPFQCRDGSYCEHSELGQGISALHGNALSFTTSGPESLFYTVFDAFYQLKLTTEFQLDSFLEGLEMKLLQADANLHSDCTRYGGFSVMVLNRLENLLSV